jgi:hypothetical protein
MTKLRVLLYCLLGGLPLLIPTIHPAHEVSALHPGHAAWFWLAGVVLAASFVPVALYGPRRVLSQFGVVASVLMMVTVLCLWSEALVFVPLPEIRQHPLRNLAGAAVIYIIVAIVLAALAAILKLPRETGSIVEMRSVAKVVPLVLVCGAAYVLYYLVFGSITFQFFTKGYYPEAAQQVVRLGLWFWVIQLGRGVLMTLAILPAIYTLRLSRMQAAIAVGVLVWVAGGLAPLLIPNAFMGSTQRFIHVIEILTQNASFGITAVLLLRRKTQLKGAASPAGATARA